MSTDNPRLAALVDCEPQEPIARVPTGKYVFEQHAREEGRGHTLPLSFAQQRLWLLDQLEPGLAVYNIARAFRITGALDVSALERAFNEIVRRHEALRTTFAAAGGQPVQVIAPHVEIPLPIVSLREGKDGEAQARQIASEEVRRPFDLARGPLMRAVLLRLTDGAHILLLTIHHIVSDGWSMSVFFEEMAQCYSAFTASRSSALSELPIQYADFASSQREQLQGAKLDGLVSYWKERLKDLPARLELPGDRPRPQIGTYGGATHTFTFDRRLTSDLKAFSRRESVTLFMTLLAGFQTLLYRWAGVEDVVVGAPIAGRPSVETERLIGFFVNTLVLRTSLVGDPTVRELLARVRETALGAYVHQDLPFEHLVELLRPERSRTQTPLFQVMFVLQNVPRREFTLPGLTLTSEHVDTGTAKFDLTVALAETPEGLTGRIEYNTDIFEVRTIERLERHFLALLAGMVDGPERRVSTLELLTPGERRELLFDWNDTATEYPRESCLHQLFERQVERAPGAVAVVDGGQALTYCELNRGANQLAHRLQAVGVGPGSLVAICVDRSASLIVGLLAILKAGGGYVPLDPRYPRERLTLMMADARVRVLLTDTRLSDCLPVPDGVLRLLLDQMDDGSNERDGDPLSLVTAEDAAYVIYTSGSTGRPKGVVVPHRAVTRLVINTNYISLHSSDVVAQAASASFDAATFEIWGALLHGARLVLIPEHVVISPTDLAAELARTRITVLFLTTAVFNMVGRECPTAFNTLTDLLVGGEVIDPTSAAAVLTNGGPQRLLNVYGPTETTTFASWHQITEAPDGERPVPIGRPLANTRLYVLDRHLQPVPIGTPGEIYIGGDALSSGYLNDPDLTSQRFISDPFSTALAARLYKTGDIGRFLANGNIEFLGRRDHQIKIRGFRVEPGEIQSTLDASPLVRESLVVAREDRSGNRRLVAYIVPAKAHSELIVKLRAFARERLPEHMVPSAWVLLEHLPLTINGKLDRAALPAPDGRHSSTVTPDRPPRDALELDLTNLWEDLLEQHPIGMSANFFELGGHSLLAARLCASIEQAFGTKLPLATFFQAATIEQQAELLRRESKDEVWPSLVPIRAGRGKPPLFCVHGVGGNILTYRDLARYLPSDQPVYCLQACGLDGKAPIHRRIEDMAGHYVAQTRQVQPHGPYAIAGMSFGGVVAFEMARQLEEQGQRVALTRVVRLAGAQAADLASAQGV